MLKKKKDKKKEDGAAGGASPTGNPELDREQKEASDSLDQILKSNRPKNIQQGVVQGVSNVLAGAIGGVGVAVLAPTVGLTKGIEQGGILGGIVGVTGGTIIGVVGAAGLIVGGAVTGVSQVVRGIAAMPQQIAAPRQGKWWNETTCEWVYTDLTKLKAPLNDDDLLRPIMDEVDDSIRFNVQQNADGTTTPGAEKTVKETYYYDILEVNPSADQSAIKRKYYVLAKKYHPDKVGTKDQESAEKFKQVAEAYQVLSDADLRAKYDQAGREGLSADKTSAVDSDIAANKPDSAMIFAFLFGSDKFTEYIGRLATATSALIGDSPKLTVREARILQERRCIRLAKNLARKLEQWVVGEQELCKAAWRAKAENLTSASFGIEMVKTIGMIYELTAVQFLGSLESGVGLPSISKWASAQSASIEKRKNKDKTHRETVSASADLIKLQETAKERLAKAKTVEERIAIQQEIQDAAGNNMIRVLWTTVVVDITSTLYETCQMVFYDQSVDKDTRKKRAQGIQWLGKIFQQAQPPEQQQQQNQQGMPKKKDGKTLYEEAAFAAMLETIKRKDEAAQAQSGPFKGK